jgi:hypothetical protein
MLVMNAFESVVELARGHAMFLGCFFGGKAMNKVVAQGWNDLFAAEFGVTQQKFKMFFVDFPWYQGLGLSSHL